MKLIVISSPAPIPDEARRINQLFDAGLEIFHLRKPTYRESLVFELIRDIEPEHHQKIALHQHHDLAAAFGINRLHFPEKNRNLVEESELQDLKTAGFRLSTSVHSLETLGQLPSCFRYAFFGPVFNSISKPGYAATIPVDFCLTEEDKTVPVIALGGIDESNIALIREMNFDGAALLGTIWTVPEKAKHNFINLRNLCPKPVPTY
jgi:thiamine-phosphate pyrophosphorylase